MLLHLPNLKDPELNMSADSSRTGLGELLSQPGQSIAFASKKSNPAEASDNTQTRSGKCTYLCAASN